MPERSFHGSLPIVRPHPTRTQANCRDEKWSGLRTPRDRCGRLPPAREGEKVRSVWVLRFRLRTRTGREKGRALDGPGGRCTGRGPVRGLEGILLVQARTFPGPHQPTCGRKMTCRGNSSGPCRRSPDERAGTCRGRGSLAVWNVRASEPSRAAITRFLAGIPVVGVRMRAPF